MCKPINVLSINNSRFAEFLPMIYPPELEVKETTDTASSTSFLDLYLEFDDSGQLSTKIYEKRDVKMTFQEIRIIGTGPCIANQLQDVNTICRRSWYIAAHVWKIYDFKIEVVPLIINFSTEYFLKRHLHLRNRLLDQGYQKIRLIRSLKKFIFRYQDLVEIYSVSAETMVNDAFSCSENV
jgi:hypothetical protein